MDNDKSNITIGLPKAGGAVYWAPLTATLPRDATTGLSEAFVNLGYISDEGLTHSTEEDTSEIRAWGKDVVMVSQNSYSETFAINLLETVRESVLQFIRGTENVVVNENGSIASGTTGDALPRGIVVVETIQNNGSTTPRYHRIVFGDCQIADRSGDVTYNNEDPLTYPVTVQAFKFNSQALPGKQTYHDDFWSAPTSA